jgi:hypothetical protein
MGLTDKREKVLREMPIIKAQVGRSKDGRWLIHRTTITHIKPMSYYKAIVENPARVQEEAIEEDLAQILG